MMKNHIKWFWLNRDSVDISWNHFWFAIKTYLVSNNRFCTLKMFSAHEDAVLLESERVFPIVSVSETLWEFPKSYVYLYYFQNSCFIFRSKMNLKQDKRITTLKYATYYRTNDYKLLCTYAYFRKKKYRKFWSFHLTKINGHWWTKIKIV